MLAVHEDKLLAAENILNQMNDLTIKAYLYFLKYILHSFNSFNAIFQSKKIIIHELGRRSLEVYKQLLSNFVKLDAVNSDLVLEKQIPQDYLHNNQIEIGPECTSLVNDFPESLKSQFMARILRFYVVAEQEMRNRLPSDGNFINELNF